MKFVQCLLILVFSPFVSIGQDADKIAVENVIVDLFKGMYNSDSAQVRKLFVPSVKMATIATDAQGNSVAKDGGSLMDFLTAIGTKRPDKLSEEIWNIKVNIDGGLAQAWCDYAFYVGKKFSHCGADAFHLVKENGQWKIFQLADTRRRSNCIIPEVIQNKFK
ncbi:MAG: nuclear transport factor 2 family protein [Cyclobacteriaceae bacterium]|jgi:hypothetical protein|nr:nuclear transport factor 2 family protein [Cyclobacteriaceae bacterium]